MCARSIIILIVGRTLSKLNFLRVEVLEWRLGLLSLCVPRTWALGSALLAVETSAGLVPLSSGLAPGGQVQVLSPYDHGPCVQSV